MNVRSSLRCRNSVYFRNVPFSDLPESQESILSILLEVWLARRDGFAQWQTVLGAIGTARPHKLVP
jgi:hypothetical protein